MKASATQATEDSAFNPISNYFIEIKDSNFLHHPIRLENSNVKYTKIPNFDFDTRVSWHQQGYMLKPRLRRIIELNDADVSTTRSMKLESQPSIIGSTNPKKKMVTISEDEERDLSPKYYLRRSPCHQSSHKAVGTENLCSQNTLTQLTKSTKNAKEKRLSAKNYNSHPTNISNLNNKIKMTRTQDKDTIKAVTKTQLKTTSKNDLKQTDIIRNKKTIMDVNENWRTEYAMSGRNKTRSISDGKSVTSSKVSHEILDNKKLPLGQNRKMSFWGDTKRRNISSKNASFDDKNQEKLKKDTGCETEISFNLNDPEELEKKLINETHKMPQNAIICKSINTETDPLPIMINQGTDVKFDNDIKYSGNYEKESLVEKFDDLDIPNVSLTKEIPKEEIINVPEKCFQDIQILPFSINNRNHNRIIIKPKYCKSGSVIIGQATLTYTRKQKINFHVFNSSDHCLCPSPLEYPMSLVSVFKKQVNTKKINEFTKLSNSEQKSDQIKTEYKYINTLQALDYPHNGEINKLVKPSQLICSMAIDKNLSICEQFQQELDFIDSFFESLQYLEKYTSSHKKFENRIGFSGKILDCQPLISSFEHNSKINNINSLGCDSLCMLNLLIQDEQRRAKNLLFVLKMREDALKDFTKSHILWLENKKKQNSTNISTLKKKQRGALLKLQFECGEMQRIRKALLTLSQKRKAALIKSKKNIELKLKNYFHIDEVLLDTKRIKRYRDIDHSRAPLKCFDLSSSGCDDSTSSRPKSEKRFPTDKSNNSFDSLDRAEKSVQTGDSILGTISREMVATEANFVGVDGGYLNILFHNLSLPQIFSSGKQYEVNEEALKNILISSNTQNKIYKDYFDSIEDSKESDWEKSSPPSTARSLIDEFDQYYKELLEEEKLPEDMTPQFPGLHENKDTLCQIAKSIGTDLVHSGNTTLVNDVMTSDSENTVMQLNNIPNSTSTECQTVKGRELSEAACQTRPFTVHAGTVINVDIDKSLDSISKSSSLLSVITDNTDFNNELSPKLPSLSAMASPVHCEAEELRRQQLAIEREIKALEQQQSQLLVVREIPDKPPPPYTPPTDSRACKPPCLFSIDDTIEEKIHRYINDPNTSIDSDDAFEVFVRDFSMETVKKQAVDVSTYPWDPYNLLPYKHEMDKEKLAKKTSAELTEVLTGINPVVVSGVSNRRSDHIDDILFTEWRRCEPEWTALHMDEALVKNQIFESIFQKVLTESIEEYKRIVSSSMYEHHGQFNV